MKPDVFHESRLDDWLQFAIDFGVGLIAGSVVVLMVLIVVWLLP